MRPEASKGRSDQVAFRTLVRENYKRTGLATSSGPIAGMAQNRPAPMSLSLRWGPQLSAVAPRADHSAPRRPTTSTAWTCRSSSRSADPWLPTLNPKGRLWRRRDSLENTQAILESPVGRCRAETPSGEGVCDNSSSFSKAAWCQPCGPPAPGRRFGLRASNSAVDIRAVSSNCLHGGI